MKGTWEQNRRLIAGLPLNHFIRLVKLVIWAADAEKEHGLELAWIDGEVMLFRFKDGIAKEPKA